MYYLLIKSSNLKVNKKITKKCIKNEKKNILSKLNELISGTNINPYFIMLHHTPVDIIILSLPMQGMLQLWDELAIFETHLTRKKCQILTVAYWVVLISKYN